VSGKNIKKLLVPAILLILPVVQIPLFDPAAEI